jgi:uncharacterized low-complexity protein
LRVNAVWVVVLGCRLSRGKASEGSEAEGKCGMHAEYVEGVVGWRGLAGGDFAWTPIRV